MQVMEWSNRRKFTYIESKNYTATFGCYPIHRFLQEDKMLSYDMIITQALTGANFDRNVMSYDS